MSHKNQKPEPTPVTYAGVDGNPLGYLIIFAIFCAIIGAAYYSLSFL